MAFSNYAMTATTDIQCKSLVVSGTYGGALSWANQTITTSGNLILDGSGTLNTGTDITVNMPTGTSGIFRIGATTGSLSAATNVNISGKVSYYNNKGGSIWKVLTIGADSEVFLVGSAATTYHNGAPPLVIGNNSYVYLSQSIRMYVTADGPTFSMLGSGTFTGDTYYYMYPNSGVTCWIPALSGTLQPQVYYTYNNATVNLSGDLYGSAFHTKTTIPGVTGCVFNTNNYRMSCSSINVSSTSINDRLTFNCGSSIITGTTFNALTTTIANEAPVVFNMGSSQWTMSSTWLFRGGYITNPGTSTVTLTGTSNITSSGSAFNNLSLAGATGKTYTVIDPLVCNNLSFNGVNHNYVQTGTTLTANGDVNFNTTAAVTLGTGITMAGPSGILTFSSTITTLTATSCILNLNNNCTLDVNKTLTCLGVVTGPNSNIRTQGSSTLVCQSSGTPIVFGTNSTFSNGTTLYLRKTTSGDMYTYGSGCSIVGSDICNMYAYANGVAVNLPELNWGAGTLTVTSNYTGTSFTHTGNIWTSGSYSNVTNNTTAQAIHDFNGYNLTCSHFRTGAYTEHTTGYSIFNYGSGIITCSSLGTSSDSKTCSINLESSTINCSGNFMFLSGWQVDPGTSVVNIKNTSTVTSNNKSFYDFYVDVPASGTVVTFANTPKFSGDFIVTQGSTNFSNLTYSGYGDYSLYGQGTHTIGSGITMMNDGTFYIDDTTGTITSAGCILTPTKNTDIRIGSKNIYLNRLILSSGYLYRFAST
jgi:hypothetical protein